MKISQKEYNALIGFFSYLNVSYKIFIHQSNKMFDTTNYNHKKEQKNTFFKLKLSSFVIQYSKQKKAYKKCKYDTVIY